MFGSTSLVAHEIHVCSGRTSPQKFLRAPENAVNVHSTFSQESNPESAAPTRPSPVGRALKGRPAARAATCSCAGATAGCLVGPTPAGPPAVSLPWDAACFVACLSFFCSCWLSFGSLPLAHRLGLIELGGGRNRVRDTTWQQYALSAWKHALSRLKWVAGVPMQLKSESRER